jgi:hypothetical protein
MTLEILQLPELKITEYHTIELTIESAKRLYGEAAEIERLANEMWLESIDTGNLYEVTDDLLKHVLFAEKVRKEAQRNLDAAKAQLLAVMQ